MKENMSVAAVKARVTGGTEAKKRTVDGRTAIPVDFEPIPITSGSFKA